MNNGDGHRLAELSLGGYRFILANASRVIALLTAAVACLVTFTDVALSGIGREDFTSSLLVMLIASYLIFFSMFDSGVTAGLESEEYTAAQKLYSEAKASVTPEEITSLREFCHRYSAEELGFRRLCYLTEHGESLDAFERFKNGEPASPRRAAVLRRAARLRAARLTPAMLLSGKGAAQKSELSTPMLSRLLSILRGLLPTTLGSLFTVSVMLTAKDGLTAEVIIEGILKLSALPMIALKGYRAGFLHSRDTLSAWNTLRSRLLRQFKGDFLKERGQD